MGHAHLFRGQRPRTDGWLAASALNTGGGCALGTAAPRTPGATTCERAHPNAKQLAVSPSASPRLCEAFPSPGPYCAHCPCKQTLRVPAIFWPTASCCNSATPLKTDSPGAHTT